MSWSSKFCLAVMDLQDGFKRINVTWGHAAGDDLLKQFALKVGNALAINGLGRTLGRR